MSNYVSDHGPRERRGFRGTAENSKTVLCTRFTSPEGCRFGDRCNFAHADLELKPRRNRFGYGAGSANGNGGPGGPPGAPPGPGGPPGAGRGRDPWQGRENAWQGQGGPSGGQYGQYNGNGGGQFPSDQAPRREGNTWGKPGQPAPGQDRSSEEHRFVGNPTGPQVGTDYQLWGGRGEKGFGGIGERAGFGQQQASWDGGQGGPRGGNAWAGGQGDQRGAQQQYQQQQQHPQQQQQQRPHQVMAGGQPSATVAPDHGWSAHSSPDGHCYYYNAHTQKSQWEMPPELGSE